MVGIVIVSHSHRIAEGVVELAREMGGPDLAMEPAGGLAMPDHPIGTDAVLVMEAIERVWSDDGVLVLMDLGSAVLSAEMALDLLPEDRRSRIRLGAAPLVEGAVAAAVTARAGGSLDEVEAEALGGLAGKLEHLGVDAGTVPVGVAATPALDGGPTVTIELEISNAHGLHARPAARFVQAASGFEARVEVRNLTTGAGPASARSLNGVATLGIERGQRIEVSATGTDAGAAIGAIERLAAEAFGERDDDGPPPASRPGNGGHAAGDAGRAAGDGGGLPASPGIAIGPVRRFHAPEVVVPDELTADDPDREGRRLDDAIERTASDVQRQRRTVAARAGGAATAIFDAHALFLQDDALLEPARRSIAAGAPAAIAWRDAVAEVAATWEVLDDPYQRARADDVRSVGRQVLAHLLGVALPPPRIDEPGILVAADLGPADTSALDPSVVRGILTAAGGPTSHASILARSLGIPAVVGAGDAVLGMDEAATIAIDGSSGAIVVDPDPAALRRLENARAGQEARARTASAEALRPAVTLDGVAIEVALNIGAPSDAAVAAEAGADGVGLFRTEFLFMQRDRMPDEDEQAAAYADAARALGGGRPLTVRTLDVGADKPLPYLEQPAEPNPFLGLRGLRLGLATPELLRTQLRAIVRVAAEHPVRVMFPMVTTLDELRAARQELDRVRAELGARAGDPEVGIMVEVPAAALLADRLAAEVAFFSIGTNDLTQYTLAADRGNERVGGLTDGLHPAVLELIGRTVEGADAHGRWVGVCGELAGDPAVTALLLGLGVRELSMSAPAIPLVKAAVRDVDLADARTLADDARRCATADEVRSLLRDRAMDEPNVRHGRAGTSPLYDAAVVVSTPDARAAAFLKGITYLRIVLTPIVMALVLAGDRTDGAYAVAGVLFAIAAITDFIDGRLARRWKQTTTWGTFLDTTADKLLVSGVLIALVAVDRASTWIAFIIIGRELLIMGLRGAVTAADGTVVSPSIWGKLKANVQFLAIFLAILRTSEPLGPLYPDQYAMIVAAAVTVGSAVEYLARFSGVLSRRRPG